MRLLHILKMLHFLFLFLLHSYYNFISIIYLWSAISDAVHDLTSSMQTHSLPRLKDANDFCLAENYTEKCIVNHAFLHLTSNSWEWKRGLLTRWSTEGHLQCETYSTRPGQTNRWHIAKSHTHTHTQIYSDVAARLQHRVWHANRQLLSDLFTIWHQPRTRPQMWESRKYASFKTSSGLKIPKFGTALWETQFQ